jgi:hypothetical protein
MAARRNMPDTKMCYGTARGEQSGAMHRTKQNGDGKRNKSLKNRDAGLPLVRESPLRHRCVRQMPRQKPKVTNHHKHEPKSARDENMRSLLHESFHTA